MNEYIFEAKQHGKYVDVTIFLNNQRRGTILLTPDEWDELRYMLNGGCYVDNEAKITTNAKSSIPLYLEGE